MIALTTHAAAATCTRPAATSPEGAPNTIDVADTDAPSSDDVERDNAERDDAWIGSDAAVADVIAAGDTWLDGEAKAARDGRFEVAIVWRRRDAIAQGAALAASGAVEQRVDELWLVAGWSR